MAWGFLPQSSHPFSPKEPRHCPGLEAWGPAPQGSPNPPRPPCKRGRGRGPALAPCSLRRGTIPSFLRVMVGFSEAFSAQGGCAFLPPTSHSQIQAPQILRGLVETPDRSWGCQQPRQEAPQGEQRIPADPLEPHGNRGTDAGHREGNTGALAGRSLGKGRSLGQLLAGSRVKPLGILHPFPHLPALSTFPGTLARNSRCPGPALDSVSSQVGYLYLLPQDSEAQPGQEPQPPTPQGRGPHYSTAHRDHPPHCLDSSACSQVFNSLEGPRKTSGQPPPTGKPFVEQIVDFV